MIVLGMPQDPNIRTQTKQWWEKRRLRYNFGLVFAGILAYAVYIMICYRFVYPVDPEAEDTLFTMSFQGFAYLIMIGVANGFYNLGYIIDVNFNHDNQPRFRIRLFRLGFWGSVALPFMIPLIVWLKYS